MAKSKERLEARKLRSQGYSVKTISQKLSVARSSISVWVRDIVLNPEQLRQLNQNSTEGRNRGRTVTSLMYQRRRSQIHSDSVREAQKLIGTLSSRELFLIGIGLYWAEGNKKSHAVRFTNSDPKLILLALRWFQINFGLPIDQIGAFLSINETHRFREDVVIDYWSTITGIPIKHFKKTIFKKTVSKKIYDNFDNHYGTLTIFVWKASKIYYKILGLIEVLGQNCDLPV